VRQLPEFSPLLNTAQVERLRAKKPRIVLPEAACDARVMIAAARAAGEGLVVPVLLGRRDDLETAASVLEISLKGCEAIYLSDSPVLEKIVQYYQTQRSKEALTPDHARAALLADPTLAAAAIVGAGLADGMVTGAITTTADVIRAAARLIGNAPGVARATSFMAMHFPPDHPTAPDNILLFADPAVLPTPTAGELAHAAVLVSQSAARIFPGLTQRIAFLSFSTCGSAIHPAVDHVRNAATQARQFLPDVPIDGDVQADAALIPAIAKRKAPGSPINGNATILVFPNLDAANIAYKLTRHLGGVRSYGPILCGLRRPASDLSRSATAEEIHATVLLIATATTEP